MKFNLKKVLITLAIIVVSAYGIATIIIFCTGGLVSTKTFDQEERFTPDRIKKIDIHTNANINLFSTDNKDIKVHLHGRYNTSVEEDIPELVAYISEDQLNLGVKVKVSKRIFIGIREMTADLDVFVPKDLIEKVNIYSSIGNTLIKNISVNQLDFKTMSGNLKIESLNSIVSNIESYSGNIDIKDFQGDLTVINVSGTILIDQYNLFGDMNVRNDSGDIKLVISEDASFSIKAITESGNINLQKLDVSIENYDENSLVGNVGTDKNMILIKTASGNINISKN